MVLLELVCHCPLQLRCNSNPNTNLRLTIVAAGRTTFVNTLCGKSVLEHKEADDATNAHIEEGVKIKPLTVGT